MNGLLFWRDVMTRIRDTGQQGTMGVAGGCIRDYLLGLEPKDIDVFINDGPNGVVPEGFERPENPVDRPEYTEGLNGIRGVQDYLYEGTAINVIYINTSPYGYVNANFDSRINQGCFILGEVILPERMMQDIERKQFTIHQMSANSMSRAERFIQKVSQVEQGWEIIVKDNEHNRAFQAAPAVEGRLHLDTIVRAGRGLNVDQMNIRLPAGWAVDHVINPPVVLAGRQADAVFVDDPLQ